MPSSISAFMPAYNEERNIEKAVSSLENVLKYAAKDYEIIVVLYEGHTDRTGDILAAMKKKNPRIRIVVQPVRRKGYGVALKMGYESSRKDLVFYTDADNQYDARNLENFLGEIKNYHMVIGYREKRGDVFMRRLAAKAYNHLVNLVLKTNTKDVDCAFKLVRREIFGKISLKSDTGMIDAELVAKARAKGFKVKELPVSHYSRKRGSATFSGFGGIIKPKIVLGLIREMVKIRKEIRSNVKK